MKKHSKDLMTRFAKRTKHPLKWWMDEADKKKTRDLWFNHKEALKWGVIDHVGIPKVHKQMALSIGV